MATIDTLIDNAIIFAAGEGSRMGPLRRSKLLAEVNGKPVIEHNLDAITGLVRRVVVVVGYQKELVKDYVRQIADKYDFKIQFVQQKEQLGTGDALQVCEGKVSGRFLLLMGDNYNSRADIQKCLQHEYSILAQEVGNPQEFGILNVRENGTLSRIIEKPKNPPSNLANCAVYVLNEYIFKAIKDFGLSVRNELEITDAMKPFAKKHKVYVVEAEKWYAFGFPWDLLQADKMLRGKGNIIGRNVRGTKNATNSYLGDRVRLYGPVYNSSIGEDSVIGSGAVVIGSVIPKETRIPPGSRIVNTYISTNCDFRHPILTYSRNVEVMIKGKIYKVNIGAIIGNDVTTEGPVKLRPGTFVFPNVVLDGTYQTRYIFNTENAETSIKLITGVKPA